jgi:hypothetical protein
MAFRPVPITLKPGIVRNSSPYAVKDRYWDSQFVHFYKDMPKRWGGWVKLTTEQLDGPCRGTLAWRTNDGARLMAFGTTDKLWILRDGELFDITPVGFAPGDDAALGDLAWGEGAWGEEGFGGINPLAAYGVSIPPTWTLAKWGQDLLAVRAGGLLYHWVYDSDITNIAEVVPDAPSICLGVFVTGERHAVVYGTDIDPVQLKWPNREGLTDWVPTAENTAGDLLLDDGNLLRATLPIFGGQLMLTDISAYTWRFIGGDFVFSKERVAGNCGIIGSNAGTELNGTAIWMGANKFFRYNGTVQEVECDVLSYIFENINRNQAWKVYCGKNDEYNEVIWLYPDKSSEEPNRYVTYDGKNWTIGALSRTCWTDESVFVSKPIATSLDGTIYQHETGNTADGQPLTYRLKTGDLTFFNEETPDAKEQFTAIRKVVLDYRDISGDHSLTIETRRRPRDAPRVKGPYNFSSLNTDINPRARGMTMAFEFAGSGPFTMGNIVAHVKPDGFA